MEKPSATSCPFCVTFSPEEVIAESQMFIAKFDLYPVSVGHALLIPKRHISSFFELSETEIIDFYNLIHLVHQKITYKYSPDGFNLGVNIGRVAGQTISHLHIHLIPRYSGDVEKPDGGIRNMIPNLVSYPVVANK